MAKQRRPLKKPKTVIVRLDVPNAVIAHLDELRGGYFGALWGRTREAVALELIRSHLLRMIESGAFSHLANNGEDSPA